MVDRFVTWFSVGVLTAGMSAAVLAGAGAAIADETGSSGADKANTSESSKPAENEADSTDQEPAESTEPESTKPESMEPEPTDEDVAEEEPAEEETTEEEEPVEEEPAREPEKDKGSDRVEDEPDTAAAPAAKAVVATQTRSKDTSEAKVDDTVAETATVAPAVEQEDVVLDAPVVDEQAETEAVAFASAPATAAITATAMAPRMPAIVRFIGTLVFNLYAVATRLLGGPPILPANSTVTVRSSTLRIDCACEDGKGVEVPADWYIPQGAEENPPERMIYLQHGFLAAGPWYSHTAAALAEQTNSIVVAPSITSNFFAADACWLGAAPMHEGMAKLFDDGNTALAESAAAAGYTGPIPDRVVLMGHSLGGGAVSGIAGYMVERETIDRLAGVVLLDGVGLDDPERMTESLRLVPLDIPIYQLAAPVYFWNNFGVGLDALVEARPDTFVGVTLVGGSHVDAMRGGNPLIQFAQELVAGFSKPQNSAAARMLMVGWVNDMFAGNQEEGIYLEPGEAFSFETPKGEASVVALPNTLTKWFPFNFLKPLVPLMDGLFTFESTCVAESVGARTAAGTCQGSIAA
ncbi:hypothetical protein SAMN04489835_0053 [Mycolicibacterium rutilum]|uniref:Alpha/beta hydrolase family protein n=1 Tax=Mycolicibacterium rutilum TaxID=370526 RepID=A0A1H6IIC6_MYCRU|nr:hypothetical protein [Mycolicibacterium rutilum]SEH46067.1 hypothetical protein SAMN04489835_0053 [Mycolicibacterium rutilum]